MKNAEDYRLKKCIFLEARKFCDIMDSLGIQAETGFEGIFYSKNDDDIDDEEVYKALSGYFDVNVTSVHCDDCDYMGVWVVYK